jgi:hypothetical protein
MRKITSARSRAALIAAITLSLLLVLGVVLAAPAQALTAPVLTKGTVTSTTVALSWTDPNTDETAYEVWNQNAACTGGFMVTSLSPNTTAYTVQNLTPNTTYTFCVRAKKNGMTKTSNSVTATTGTGTTTTTTTPPPTTTTPPPTTTTPPPTTTTPPPTTTTTTTPPACVGTQVVPGDSIQAKVDATASGGTLCFATGTYTMTSGVITGTKALTFDFRAGADPDAVLDGNSGGFIGFTGAGPPDATGTSYLGGVFQHFGNATAPLYAKPIIMQANDLVDGGEFRLNYNGGLTLQGSNAHVTNAYVHDNGRYGVTASACGGCADPVGAILENSEISFNNTNQNPPGDDAGGTKFTHQNGMIVRNNNVHDNYGSGLWWDIYNSNIQVYGNNVHDNFWWGIFYEISTGTTSIHDNILTNNALGATTWYNGVQLLVSCSDGSIGGIDIGHNTIDGTAKALGVINHAGHIEDSKNVYFHNNHVYLRDGGADVGGNAYDGETWLFTDNNRYDYNDYHVTDLAAIHFRWNNVDMTWSQWRAAGMDANGTIALI